MDIAPPTVLVPTLESVRDLLSDLSGEDVELSAGDDPVPVGAATGSVIGLYVDAGLTSRALIVLDLPLAAYSGAALGLVPPGEAQDAVGSGGLTEVLRESCCEVLRILASLFDRPGAPRLRLHATFEPGQQLRPDVAELAVRSEPRDDIEVGIAGYGTGHMSVVIV